MFAYPYVAYTKESVFVLKMSGIDMQVYDIGVNNFKNINIFLFCFVLKQIPHFFK